MVTYDVHLTSAGNNYVSGSTGAAVYFSDDDTICSSTNHTYRGGEVKPYLDYPVWETGLWKRSARSMASARINRLQGQLTRARGAVQKRRVELEILWEGDVIRRSGDR